MEDVKPTGGAAAEEEAAEDDDTDAMARMMGFGGFGSTSGKKVGGNDEVGSTNVKKERKWRQARRIAACHADARSTCTGCALMLTGSQPGGFNRAVATAFRSLTSAGPLDHMD